MKTVMAIEKREDVNPKEGKEKYGDVPYADEKNKKYPLDKEHIHAAISYWGMPKNRAKYSAEDQKTIGARIRSYAKKWGVEMADDDKKAESSLVSAASIDLEGETPVEIIYFPKGDWRIKPMVNGKAKEVAVKVDANVAALMQRELSNRLGQTVRPYASFDHKPGPASFIPKEFKWDDTRGVVLEVDWTQAGKEAVSGRNYSYFSPTFLLSDKGEVAGLPKTGEIGSLTNNPAFREIERIAAAMDNDDDDEKGVQECPKCGDKFKSKKAESMDATTEKLVELKVITSEQADDPERVIKAVADMYANLGVVQATNARLMSENTALAAKVADVQKAEATSIIEAAIAEGKIGAKDKSSIDFWTAQLTSSPETTKKVLASMPANPLLKRVIDVKVSDGKRVAAGQSEADLVQAQHLAVREVQEAHPNLSYADCFARAKSAHPEVFPVEA